MVIQVELSFGVDGGAEQFGKAVAEELFEIFGAQDGVEEGIARELLSQLIDAVLNLSELMFSVHVTYREGKEGTCC
jgi:hypothetical protein